MHIVARHHSVLGPLQPLQPVPFLLGSSRFVPSPSPSAVKRNFLLCPIRNLSLCRDHYPALHGGPRCDKFAYEQGGLMSTSNRRKFIGRGAAVAAGAAAPPAPPADAPRKPPENPMHRTGEKTHNTPLFFRSP